MTNDPEDLAGAGRLIAHFLNRLPAGWRFLLRSNEDARGGFMCNLMGPEVAIPVVTLAPGRAPQVDDDTLRFPAFAATASGAVTAAAELIPQHVWIGERDGLG